ncbi:WG repeat-containing protein [Flavilitoribacter nigricans]|nr:WG repeat-containing protein [Flavilitoribacter nigricans]
MQNTYPACAFFLMIILTACSKRSALPPDEPFISREKIYAQFNYDWIGSFSEGLAPARIGADFFVIGRDGRRLFDNPYDSKRINFHDGLVNVRKDGRYGYIDRRGREIIAPQFSTGARFIHGRARAARDGQSGLIRRSDLRFDPIDYDWYTLLLGNRQYLPVVRNGKFGIMRPDKQLVVPIQYDFLLAHREDLLIARSGARSGLLNYRNDTLIPFIYESLQVNREGPPLLSAKKEGKWGLINLEQDVLLPFIYDEIYPRDSGRYFRVKKDGGYQFLNQKLEYWTDTVYNWVSPVGPETLLLMNNRQSVLLDLQSGQITPLPYSHIQHFRDGVAFLREGDRYGAVNRDLEVIIPPEYDRVQSFFDGLAWVVRDGQHYLIDRRGDPIHPEPFDDAHYSHLGIMPVKRGDAWGLINRRGEVVTEFIYDQIKTVDEVGFIVGKDRKNGLINFGGEWILPLEYNYLAEEKTGHILAEKDGKFGLYFFSGKPAIPLEYDGVRNLGYRFGSGYPAHFRVNKGTVYGIYNVEQAEEPPFRFQSIGSIRDGGMIARIEGQYGLIDYRGTEILPLEYSRMIEKEDYNWIVLCREKCGLSDRAGNIKIPLEYEELDFLQPAFIRARRDGRWGLITIDETVRIPFEYEELVISGGYTRVRQDGKWGIVNRFHETLVPIAYDQIGRVSDGIACVRRGEQWGFVDTTGVSITAIQYDGVRAIFKGFGMVEKDGKYGMVNDRGEEVIPIVFTDIKVSYDRPDGGDDPPGSVRSQEFRSFKVKLENYTFILDRNGDCAADCPPPAVLEQYGIKPAR